MSPGRVHQLGQYVSGEVHNAVGQFVLGTKCLLTVPYSDLCIVLLLFQSTNDAIKFEKGNLHTLDMHWALLGLICIFGQNLTNVTILWGMEANFGQSYDYHSYTKELGKKRGG